MFWSCFRHVLVKVTRMLCNSYLPAIYLFRMASFFVMCVVILILIPLIFLVFPAKNDNRHVSRESVFWLTEKNNKENLTRFFKTKFKKRGHYEEWYHI